MNNNLIIILNEEIYFNYSLFYFPFNNKENKNYKI